MSRPGFSLDDFEGITITGRPGRIPYSRAVWENSFVENYMKSLPVRFSVLLTLTILPWPETVNAQILNPGFENWTDCLPDDWATPNACGVLIPITVSWPANVSGYVLQSTPALAPPVWVNVPGVGPGNSHPFTAAGTPLYFRLVKSE